MVSYTQELVTANLRDATFAAELGILKERLLFQRWIDNQRK